MSPVPKATLVGRSLRACLENIRQQNGYFTELKAVYGPRDRVPEKPPLPYALVRAASDSRTSIAGQQATRVRTFEVEVVFPRHADDPEAALDAAQIDVLRALGIGQDLDRQFSGLVEEEDEAVFRYAEEKESTHSITIHVGVLYVATYN